MTEIHLAQKKCFAHSCRNKVEVITVSYPSHEIKSFGIEIYGYCRKCFNEIRKKGIKFDMVMYI